MKRKEQDSILRLMGNGSCKAECLDFVEASHRERAYPVMYCHMEIAGAFDIEKLRRAVEISGKYIPEILYSYDFKHNQFIRHGFTLDDIIQMTDQDFETAPIWDLRRHPQLIITIYCSKEKTKLIFGMSHILSDGAGFLQYLYLLASLYNGCLPERGRMNQRNISEILRGIHVKQRTEQTKYGKVKPTKPLHPCSGGTECFLIKHEISSGDFKKLRKKAEQHHVTLNDVFMTAYARVVARMQKRDKVAIDCPADLRRFQKTKHKNLTLANMTGLYRGIVIECGPRYDFTSTATQVHIEMELQKSRRRCFKGLRLLAAIYPVIPRAVLRKMVKAAYRMAPVSYTNVGIIEQEKLVFRDCYINDCIITGTYRQSPDFQLTVSTFREVCTLNCTLIGDFETKSRAKHILDQVASELLGWLI